MKNKKMISLLLALIVVFTLIVTQAYAESANTEGLQKSYQNQLDNIQSNEKLSDADKILQIVNLYYTAKAENNKNDSCDIDLSIFLNTVSNDFEINKIINSVKLIKLLRQKNGETITSDNLTLTINNLDLTNDTAIVKLDELYEYQLNDVPLPSGHRFRCTVNLLKIDGYWLITSIVSDDEFITDEMGSTGFDCEKQARKLLSCDNKPDTNSSVETTIDSLSFSSAVEIVDSPSLPILNKCTTYYYNRTAAKNWAVYHALDYSSMFPDYSGYGDCANFGSQCVWRGFGGYDTYADTYEPPMYSSWWSYEGYAHDNWLYVDLFYNVSVLGGNELYAANYSYDYRYIEEGDILQLKLDDYFFHTYVVSYTMGTYGSRTANDIFICSHTSDRLSERLTSCWDGVFRHLKMISATW